MIIEHASSHIFPQAVLDLSAAEELTTLFLHQEMLPKCIDISGVQRLTTSGIQFLISLAKTAEKINHPLSFTPQSEVMATSFAILGLSGWLNHYKE